MPGKISKNLNKGKTELQKCFQLTLLLTRSLIILGTAGI